MEFYRPVTLDQLFDIQRQYQDGTKLYFSAGNTGENFEDIVYQQRDPIVVQLTQLVELQVLEENVQGLLLGACITMAKLQSYVDKNQHLQQLYQILFEQLEYNASRQVQNQATIGGHILNHSRKHTSDILPILYVSQTKSRFIHLLNRNEVEIGVEDLSSTNRDDLLLVSIFIPFIGSDEHLQSYKQARRRKHDTGIVTCALRLKLGEDNTTIQYFDMAIGGLGDGVVLVPEATRSHLNSGRSVW